MSEPAEIHHGFKRITAANWRDADVTKFFPRLTPEAWVRPFLRPQLNAKVPTEIAALFEVARGSMIYGWFFYPVITLASQQCYRVLETAARMRCELAGISTRKPQKAKTGKRRDTTFDENIRALAAAGIISAGDKRRWDAARQLRNWSSHPTRQSIQDPATAKSGLNVTVELVNKLYV
jgi:hypothetical protein